MAKTTRTKKGQKSGAPANKGARSDAVEAKAGRKEAVKDKSGKKEKAGLRSRAQKAQAARQAKGGSGERRGAGKFLREVKVELSKVTWPNREELTQSTIVVFVAIAIAALYIAFFDEIFTRFIELIS